MEPVKIIPISNLLLGLIPLVAVIFLQYRWGLNFKNSIYAALRMLAQLLLIGYFLVYLFGLSNSLSVLLVLLFMVVLSSWISLHSIKENRLKLYSRALLSIAFGGGISLFLMVFFILNVEPWYKPTVVIPIAGMTFANAMNSVSLAAERFSSEMKTFFK